MEEHSGAGDDNQSPTAKWVTLKKTKANHFPSRLPKGLAGTKSTAHVKISGTQTTCLLDTGSRVTTIPLSYHAQFLADQPIRPLTALLEIEGANRQEVPYLGYVELCVTFPKDFVGTERDVSTLALEVPTHCGNTRQQVLIGTNTLDFLYSDYCHYTPRFLPAQHGYRAVLKIMELRYKYSQDGNLGLIKLQGQTP